MGLALFCLIFGFTVGYLWRDSRPEKIKKEEKPKNRNILSYNERQRAKIRHQNDAERIRELNLLSTNESKFMRLLQHQFIEHKIIIKKNQLGDTVYTYDTQKIWKYCAVNKAGSSKVTGIYSKLKLESVQLT